jgi:hypothetical protein
MRVLELTLAFGQRTTLSTHYPFYVAGHMPIDCLTKSRPSILGSSPVLLPEIQVALRLEPRTRCGQATAR